MNKKVLKRALALSMSLFMAVSSFNVYAQDVASDNDTSEEMSEENYDADTSSDDIGYEEDIDSGYAVDDEVDSQTTTELPADTSVYSDPTMDTLENLEYFLVESPLLNAPDTENFVASFVDASSLSDFSITVKDSNGNEEVIYSNTVSGNLVKFSKEYTKGQSGEYSVTKLCYVKNECAYYLDLSSMDVKFGVNQEYDGYDELVSLDSLDEESSLEGVIQVTSLEDAQSEVASGIAGDSAAMSISDFENEISAQSNENIVICLDPGHGGADSGAVGNGVYEKDLTLKIANYCKEELEKYNCTVVMTRTTDVRLGSDASSDLVNRVQVAKNAGASYIISIHLNSGTTTSSYGAEVYYPNTSSKPNLSTQGKNLASNIISQLGSLGITMRGIYVRGYDSGIVSTDSNSSEKDYYGIIRHAKTAGITGIIVEHCFINNASDYQNFLSSDAKLKNIGVADAKGIVAALGLTGKREQLDALAKAHESDLSNGTYVISSALNSNYVLDVNGGSSSSGANIQLYQSNGTTAQQFKISHDSTGYVTITNVKSGKVLDVYDGKTNNGQNVWQYTSNNTWAQKWIVTKSSNGYQVISALNSNYVLDLSDGVIRNGKNIQIYSSNGTNAQKWTFDSYVDPLAKLDQLAKDNKSVISDGTYVIASALNSNYVLDVSDGSSSNGANIQLYQSNGTKAQAFKITHDSTGYVIITNVKSGKVLDVSDGVASNGKNVWQYGSNSTRAQKWIVKKNGSGYTIISAIDSNYVLDLSDGVVRNGKNIQIYSSNGTNAQKWNFSKFVTQEEKLDQLAKDNKTVISDGTYVISSALNSNYLLDVSDGSSSNGANIQLYQSNGTTAQQFKVTHDSTGYVTLTNVKSGKVLDVSDGVASNGKNVWQYGSNSTRAQKWVVTKSGNSYQMISAINSNYVLDLSDGVVRNGKNIHIYSSNGTNAQKWNFVTPSFTSITGSAKTSVAQMVRYFKANNGTYDKFSKYGTTYDGVLAKGGASTIEQFCQIFYEEAVSEGIRPEVAFCQSMKETGFLKYGGQVKPDQYNFAGIGATDGGAEGAKFDNVRTGIRAQIQHLKAYANKDSLKYTCVDPRFNLVTRGSAQYVEWLGKKENPNGYGWATAQNYGYDIVNMMNVLLSK